jgi:hypothetical protein
VETKGAAQSRSASRSASLCILVCLFITLQEAGLVAETTYRNYVPYLRQFTGLTTARIDDDDGEG